MNCTKKVTNSQWQEMMYAANKFISRLQNLIDLDAIEEHNINEIVFAHKALGISKDWRELTDCIEVIEDDRRDS